MKEKGIPFNEEMVRAILNTKPGVWPAEAIDPSKPWKWQTRRLMKPQPAFEKDGCVWYPKEPKSMRSKENGLIYANEKHFLKGVGIDFAPYGPVGRQLWVRESYCRPDFGDLRNKDLRLKVKCFEYLTEMDVERFPIGGNYTPRKRDFKWHSARFMPREASRIDLKVMNVYAHRIQSISEFDIIGEGCPPEYLLGINWFRPLWEKIHGAGAWERNDFVFAYDFMRLK